MDSVKVRPNFGWKLRLLLRVQSWLLRLRILPTADTYARWPVARRKAMKPAAWMTYPPPPSVQTKREAIATADGPLELKLFGKAGLQAPRILFIHGGGWMLCGVDSLDYLCANLCDRGLLCRPDVGGRAGTGASRRRRRQCRWQPGRRLVPARA